MLLSPDIKNDGFVVLVRGDGDHTGLAIVSVHGNRGVSAVLESDLILDCFFAWGYSWQIPDKCTGASPHIIRHWVAAIDGDNWIMTHWVIGRHLGQCGAINTCHHVWSFTLFWGNDCGVSLARLESSLAKKYVVTLFSSWSPMVSPWSDSISFIMRHAGTANCGTY